MNRIGQLVSWIKAVRCNNDVIFHHFNDVQIQVNDVKIYLFLVIWISSSSFELSVILFLLIPFRSPSLNSSPFFFRICECIPAKNKFLSFGEETKLESWEQHETSPDPEWQIRLRNSKNITKIFSHKNPTSIVSHHRFYFMRPIRGNHAYKISILSLNITHGIQSIGLRPGLQKFQIKTALSGLRNFQTKTARLYKKFPLEKINSILERFDTLFEAENCFCF